MSIPTIKAIRTEEGDCLIDYNYLANKPIIPDDVMSEAKYDPDGAISKAGGIAKWIAATYENAEVNSY